MAKKVRNIKQLVSETLVSAGNKSAKTSCGQSCVFVLYEPKQPKALKKRHEK